MVMSLWSDRLKRILRIGRSFTFPLLKQQELFPYDLIVHFSYHKCLTAYYIRIIRRLSEEFRFPYQHFTSDLVGFENAVFNWKGKKILSLNNRISNRLDELPNYRGSHFVRDPRDLIVSGYRYHLWTREKWCITPAFDWTAITAHPYFVKFVESDQGRFPVNISYQNYLRKLDVDRGMLVELIWRQPGFEQMKNWNYYNPHILEMKYEQIIGNEADAFRAIFSHYGFHPKIVEHGVKFAEEFSLKNQKKSPTGHIRKGISSQWKSEFTARNRELFNELNGDLVALLEYEK